MMTKRTAAMAALMSVGTLAACGGPRPIPVMENGQLLPERTDAVVEQARRDGENERELLAEHRAADAAVALATCSPEICDAIARGELAVGMNEAQVLASTRTTPDAWDYRPSGSVTLMTARPGAIAPRDALGEIAFVSLQSGGVNSYTYREAQGFRTVSSVADASLAGRAAATADALLREGDSYAAAGRLDLALDRYDRADVIRPGHADTSLRIASTLDKQLRPIEAVLRYQMFIHQMELEKIAARGEAAARMAEAIALAQQRIIVLDRR
jgi:tetratricopeptide (TPR) repeat protein